MKGIVIDLKDISDSREMMESRESPKISWFIYILLAALVTALILACLFDIDEYTRVNGEIKTQEAASSVISLNNCKLKETLVTEGQNVKTGDTLFILDSDYAESQKSIIEEKLNTVSSDLKNTQLLKQSVEENKNLFKNNDEDSKFYYRFEQYKNGTLLTAEELNNSISSDNLSKKEKENAIASAKTSLSDKQSQLAEYRALLSAVSNNGSYSGGNASVNAAYNEYSKSLQKAELLCEQYRNSYENLQKTFEQQSADNSDGLQNQLESVKQEAEKASSALNDHKNNFLTDVRSQILLIENQLITDKDNEELKKTLEEYNKLKDSVEKDESFSTENTSVQTLYDKFVSLHTSLKEDLATKNERYSQVYNDYISKAGTVKVTEADVQKAKSSYDSAVIDSEAIKTSFISQVQSKITALNDEIKSLESNKKNLELAAQNNKDHEAYEKLTADKMKTEAVIAINSEIDSLNDSIINLKSQIAEIDETISNSEIKANVDGTVTLINERNTGDIVQAGEAMCSIIPGGSELKATLYIPENEIAKINPGQKTEYIFDSIPYDEYGKITGEILSVSADSIADQTTGMKYYIAKASLSSNSLTNKAGNIREVRTGMMLEARSITGSKKAITWLLEKINFID